MIYLDILQLIVLLITCIISCLSDMRIGKIKNKLLLASSALCIVFVLIRMLVFKYVDLFSWCGNFILIGFFSLLLYITHIWAGGDCKLSLFVAVFYPSNFLFIYNDIKITLCLFLIIAFCFGIVYLVFDSFISLIKKKKTFSYKTFLMNLKEMLLRYIKSLIYLTFLNQIYLFFVAPYYTVNSVIYVIIAVAFVFGVNKIVFLSSPIMVISFLVFDILMMVFTGNNISGYFSTYLLVLLFMIIRSFTINYNYQVINTSHVCQGMVLSRIDTILFQKSRVKGLPSVSDETLKSRITKDEAESIHRWENSKFGKSQITIVKKIPFGIFIMFGVILYCLLGVLQYCNLF